MRDLGDVFQQELRFVVFAQKDIIPTLIFIK